MRRTVTTRLKGRPPILTCLAADQPVYPDALAIADPKTAGDADPGTWHVLGWLRPWRDPGLMMVIACRSGLMQLIGMTAKLDVGTVERATAFLADFHRTHAVQHNLEW